MDRTWRRTAPWRGAGRRPPRGALLEELVEAASRVPAADLPTVAAIVGRGLDATWCRVETWSGPERREADWPVGRRQVEGAALTRVLVRYGRLPAGQLTVELRSRPRAAVRAELADVAAVLGPVLQADALGQALDRQVHVLAERAAAVAESRRLVVIEQEEERRGLERNLHDGAQHQLIALRMAVGLLQHELATGAVAAARSRFPHLRGLLDLAGDTLSATAAGVLPPALVASGLVPALELDLRAAPRVTLHADRTVRERRYPPKVEVTVYFACMEAVNNAKKYAPEAAVGVWLEHSYRGVSFVVQDDGPGFDVSTVGPHSGLTLLTERLADAGGELTLSSSAGAGTLVEGFIPV